MEHGVVVVATGAQEYHPNEYLYGQDKKIVTQIELEEHLGTGGEWSSPGNNSFPKTVVMIQCVGSRDEERPYCSRICCSEAVKNALKIKELSPETNVYILYRDIRTYGFKEGFYTKAREQGVRFIRYEKDRKPEVSQNGSGLQVEVFEQSLKTSIEISTDLVVLSAGIVADSGNEKIAQFLKVPLNQDKFFLEAHMKLRPVDFATDGVFLCGLAHSSKAIDESIIQAQATASRAATILSKDSIELEATIFEVVDENCDGCAYCVEPCPYQAITLLEYMSKGSVKKTVQVNESACKGCGCCMATCPKKGISVKGFTLEQLAAQVNAALGVG
ncbi:MAG: 4Fe-4S dicluster domain-containing protein [Acidobacteria bacterium]|nr:4Fe-4S dicluster domain-containing protein [Acidobacteriota bacterium]